MKDGVKTSELYYSLLVSAVGMLVLYGQLSQEQANAWIAIIGAILTAGPSMLYAAVRTYLKVKEMLKEGENMG